MRVAVRRWALFERQCVGKECVVGGDCGTGFYLSGTCAHSANTACMLCTNAIIVDSTDSGSGGAENACLYMCKAGYTYGVSSGTYVLIIVASSCMTGAFVMESCSHSSDFVCVACYEEPANGTRVQG